jgi:phosphoribosylaminoimidazolesuccinocarboxamide synthase
MSTNEIHAQGGEIIIYQTPDGQTDINVQMKDETVWLDRHQMAILFDRDVKTIGKHIANALREELDGGGVAKFATPVPKGANPGQTQLVERSYYNLDVIISVEYRVKSKRGVDFRRWANRVLKDYLIKGYVINRNIISQRYEELKQLVQVMGRTADMQESLTTTEAHDMINVVSDYAYALDTLDRYDYEQLRVEATTQEGKFHATYEAAMDTIHTLCDKFGGSTLFGNEKAAMLLYLVTKNHSFSDGNKRIAATLFLWFMQQNGILYKADGSKRITDGTLVALTLMIAESRTEEKDVMVKVVVNLINKNNE